MTSDVQPVSCSFQSQGLKLHYLDWGNAERPLLILVHGMQDHARSWDAIARALCQDWHVVAVDLRGHGDSDWSPDGAYHNAYYVQDFADLVTALGADTVTIIAHSLGGNPTARFAALYPARVERLVLVDAMGPSAPVLERWDSDGVVNRARSWLEKRRELPQKPARRFAVIGDAAARLIAVNPRLSRDQAEHLARHGLRQHDDGYGWKYDPMVGNFLPEDFAIDLAEYWREITAPTLICWGTESWTTNPATDGRGRHFRHHRNLAFDGAGHWLHHDQCDEFIRALMDFLG